MSMKPTSHPAYTINSREYSSYLNRRTRGFSTSDEEIRDLIKAWAAISLAFAIVMGGLSKNIVASFLISSLSVGLGFIFHEMAHKIVAQRYGCFAEFRANNQMLLFAIITSFLGIVFAVPGAVMISGNINKQKNGIISLAGPAMNFLLAALFFILQQTTTDVLNTIGQYGFMINAWLGLFNMIPFLNFDGRKILAWNKIIYAITLVCGFLIFNLGFIVRSIQGI